MATRFLKKRLFMQDLNSLRAATALGLDFGLKDSGCCIVMRNRIISTARACPLSAAAP
jgi:hypothetical protein